MIRRTVSALLVLPGDVIEHAGCLYRVSRVRLWPERHQVAVLAHPALADGWAGEPIGLPLDIGGDVVLCLPAARRQSAYHHVPPSQDKQEGSLCNR